jgi:hypothetical protein
MFEVKVKNLQGIQTHGASFESEQEAQSWVSSILLKPSIPWGKVHGSYLESELSEAEIATKAGVIEIDGITKHVIPNQFTVEINEYVKPQDILNLEFKKYLADTDWYIVRHVETGVAIPQDILTARALARQSIVE